MVDIKCKRTTYRTERSAHMHLTCILKLKHCFLRSMHMQDVGANIDAQIVSAWNENINTIFAVTGPIALRATNSAPTGYVVGCENESFMGSASCCTEGHELFRPAAVFSISYFVHRVKPFKRWRLPVQHIYDPLCCRRAETILIRDYTRFLKRHWSGSSNEAFTSTILIVLPPSALLFRQ